MADAAQPQSDRELLLKLNGNVEVLAKAIEHFSETLKYLDEKNTPIANNVFAGFVRDAAQKYIKPKVVKNREHFYFKSSPGRPPHWADVPWIGIYDPNVTTTAQHGYYITYLFSIDMKRVYLNLNQGMTDLESELGTKGAAQELLRRGEFIRDRVPEY